MIYMMIMDTQKPAFSGKAKLKRCLQPHEFLIQSDIRE